MLTLSFFGSEFSLRAYLEVYWDSSHVITKFYDSGDIFVS